jgi:hypothetical protein
VVTRGCRNVIHRWHVRGVCLGVAKREKTGLLGLVQHVWAKASDEAQEERWVGSEQRHLERFDQEDEAVKCGTHRWTACNSETLESSCSWRATRIHSKDNTSHPHGLGGSSDTAGSSPRVGSARQLCLELEAQCAPQPQPDCDRNSDATKHIASGRPVRWLMPSSSATSIRLTCRLWVEHYNELPPHFPSAWLDPPLLGVKDDLQANWRRVEALAELCWIGSDCRARRQRR